MTDEERKRDALRYKLIDDIYDLPVWVLGEDRMVAAPWHTLMVEERDLIVEALGQWKPR